MAPSSRPVLLSERSCVVQYATQFASPQRTVRLRLLHERLRPVQNMHDMADLEARNNAADVYLWLGLRLDGFVDLVAAEDYRDEVPRCAASLMRSGIGLLTAPRVWSKHHPPPVQLVAALNEALQARWNISRRLVRIRRRPPPPPPPPARQGSASSVWAAGQR